MYVRSSGESGVFLPVNTHTHTHSHSLPPPFFRLSLEHFLFTPLSRAVSRALGLSFAPFRSLDPHVTLDTFSISNSTRTHATWNSRILCSAMFVFGASSRLSSVFARWQDNESLVPAVCERTAYIAVPHRCSSTLRVNIWFVLRRYFFAPKRLELLIRVWRLLGATHFARLGCKLSIWNRQYWVIRWNSTVYATIPEGDDTSHYKTCTVIPCMDSP